MVRVFSRLSGSHPSAKPIGNYIVDFYCAKAKLVIEVDGSQHYEADGPLRDAKRTADLAQYGLRVIRVNNADVNRNFSGVCEYIDRCIRSALEAQSDSSPTSLV
jgi:very-short-patch-repair endonuclease